LLLIGETLGSCFAEGVSIGVIDSISKASTKGGGGI